MKTRETVVVLGLVIGLAFPLSIQAKWASRDLENLFDGNLALAHAAALVDFGPKIAGGPAELEAAEYIAHEMERYGLEVEVQGFPQTFYEDFGSGLEVVDGPALSPITMLYAPPGELSEIEIVFCGLGYPEDFDGIDVDGKIALMERGLIPFADKVANAAANGASAGIVFNNVPGNMSATLGSMADIPAVMISQEDGTVLLGLLEVAAPVAVNLTVDAVWYPSTSHNVIGTLPGIDPDQGTVYMGAHYDSPWHGPGANDNCAAVGAILEAARVFATKSHRTKATIRFCAFGAAMVGNEGSAAYVLDRQDEISATALGMINLDMISVGDILNIGNIGWADSGLSDYAQEKAMAMEIEGWAPWAAPTNSDHVYFEWIGVPVVYLNQSPDPNYNTPEDTLDKIDVGLLERNGQLAAAVLYGWAKNPALRAKKEAGK